MSFLLQDVSVQISGQTLLQPLSLRADPGELIGLVGPNGAGKSTLLKAITGLWPSQGLRRLGETRLDKLPAMARARLVSYLPQDKICDPYMRVRDVAALGRLPWRSSKAETGIIEKAMTRCQVRDLAERPMSTLSGGQKARALLSRVLAGEADLVLADEPTTALDLYHQRQIMQTLKDEADQGRIVLAALHDLQLARRFCHRVIVLSDGRLYADGPPETVFNDQTLQDVFRVTRKDAGLV